MQPLGQVSCFFDGSHTGRLLGSEQARMPDSPSTIVARRSGPVEPMRVMRGTLLDTWLVISAPVLVFPEPRPDRMNSSSHSACHLGGRWSARAWGCVHSSMR